MLQETERTSSGLCTLEESIPKAKDFRLISLSSSLLKCLDRILDYHLRSKLDSKLISLSQQAYLKGKSSETALHEVLREMESSLKHNTEGACNNVTTDRKGMPQGLTSGFSLLMKSLKNKTACASKQLLTRMM